MLGEILGTCAAQGVDNVKNDPQYKNALLQAIRARLEYRAFWLYLLCDIAMCGDHGIGECYGSVPDLPGCIAKGDDMCCLRYHKKEK